MVPRSLQTGFQVLVGADSKAARGTEYTWKATIFPALNLVDWPSCIDPSVTYLSLFNT
jgi:hypothetical protein